MSDPTSENDIQAQPGEGNGAKGGLPGMGIPDDISRTVMDAVGMVWSRPLLTHRERSLVTLGAIIALRCDEALRVHLRLGLENGLTNDQIYEVILQAGAYAGFGVAVDAFQIAQQVLSAP